MSEKNMARRAAFQVRFAGTDITKSVEPYLLQMTYVDNEEDETDDLQLKLQDRDGIWLESGSIVLFKPLLKEEKLLTVFRSMKITRNTPQPTLTR